MDAFAIISILLVIIVAGLIVYLASSRKEKGGDQSLTALLNQLNDIRQTLNSGLASSIKATQTNSDRSAEAIERLQEIQNIFKNTKQRGMLGEFSLDVILKNSLPKNYEQQYRFKDGDIVDFIIRVGDKLIPIDSKFSLENYQRKVAAETDVDKAQYDAAFKSDIKTRIDETSKYVKPNENTVGFAFMFIPSEAIYYDLLDSKIGDRDLIVYAAEKHVTIVSPATLMAYLQTVLQGLKALSINESTKEILKNVIDLQRHLASYQEYMDKIRNNIVTLTNTYELASGELKKIDKDILRVNGKSVDVVSKDIEASGQEDRLI
jgi:DNA recombination protein RmuC